MTEFANLKGRDVILTGHTGFKGAWIAAWLTQIGAKVHGISLAPEDGPNLHVLLGPESYASSHIQDIRDYAAIKKIIDDTQPAAVFHLAAQALVRPSYADPLESFSSNIMGTANMLEACRGLKNPPAIVCVTTDKVYQNDEEGQAFKETDRIAGKDPYSASKAGAEMIARSYETLFKLEGETRPRMAIARGGNVIGGGDWSVDRIVPDAIRSAMTGTPLRIRSPDAVRPWQHVLELCHGYMTLADGLLSDTPAKFEGPWNFGPDPEAIVTVYELAASLAKDLPEELTIETDTAPSVPEAHFLTLDISKAEREIGWTPALEVAEGVKMTGEWYADFMKGEQLAKACTYAQLDAYIQRRS